MTKQEKVYWIIKRDRHDNKNLYHSMNKIAEGMIQLEDRVGYINFLEERCFHKQSTSQIDMPTCKHTGKMGDHLENLSVMVFRVKTGSHYWFDKVIDGETTWDDGIEVDILGLKEDWVDMVKKAYDRSNQEEDYMGRF